MHQLLVSMVVAVCMVYLTLNITFSLVLHISFAVVLVALVLVAVCLLLR